ncbi:MAG: hypothetical protein RL651_514 [Pseudomonadota bacterium]
MIGQLIASLQDPFVVIDQNYVICFANEAYTQLHNNVSSESVLGKKCYEISHGYSLPCDQSGESCPLSASRESGTPERVVHIHRHADKDLYESIDLTPLKNAQGEIIYFLEKLQPLHHFSPSSQRTGLTGKSSSFMMMLDYMNRVAPTDTTVLIQGESGTGKELVARAIHDSSKRSLKPFITVDCTGLPESLIESELFGHEKGAFTGAYALKRGLVEEADGGTLFLDEIGDIPLGLQAKLLRFLESGTYRRVGSNMLRHADVRLLSATHRPLKDLVLAEAFRNDLYYRISTFPIFVPSLRERRDDIPILISSLLKRIEKGSAFKVSDQALDLLLAYEFPGNIRELKNVLERAVLLCDGKKIKPEHLPDEMTIVHEENVSDLSQKVADHRFSGEDVVSLLSAGYSRREVALQLGISERTLYRILRALK